jgi:hypothetical protein
MREGTTSRVVAAERPYGEFYDFYSVSSEYFGYTLVHLGVTISYTENNRIVHSKIVSSSCEGKPCS